MIIRKYQITDTEMIMNLFYNTVHEINIRDYTQAQVDAWATKNLNYEYWLARLKIKQPLVAEISGEIVGFVELEADGHIDCFYCHSQYQNQGIGTQLLNYIEDIAKSKNNQKLYAEVSITAKPFFLKRGFSIIKEQQVERRGEVFKNYVMEKEII
ncbi:MAG: GNAT family N-acetyltransferase [Sphaerospermopsis sp. SIO1G2]|nr:GNAT family N-acetyltransferase [Sphaerospermopsis sp. SIO1G2]